LRTLWTSDTRFYVGEIEFEHSTLAVENAPDLRLVIYTPVAGESTRKARRLFGSDRRRDFEFLRRFGKILTLQQGGSLQGYLAQMPTPGRTMLGPGGADTPDALLRLVRHAVGETLGELSLILPARSHENVRPLLALGFRLVGLSNLMFRGAWQPPSGAYAYSLFPESH